jgi:hypothetical protein
MAPNTRAVLFSFFSFRMKLSSKFPLWGLMGLALLLSSPSWGATGRVAGRVVNKSTGKSVPGVAISLVRPGEKSDRLVARGKSDAQGRFSIGPFPYGETDIFMAQVKWKGFDYETVAFDGTGQLKELMKMEVNPNALEIAVYDTTRQEPPMVFTAHHIALESKERVMKCTERIVVENSSNTTYIGDESGATVKLDIPSTAEDVKLDDKVQGKLLKTADGYAVAKPLWPASARRRNAIILTYTMKWPQSLPWNRKIDLSKKILYPTNFFFVNRGEADKELKVVAPKLGKDTVTEIPVEGGEMVPKIVNSIGSPMTPDTVLKPGDVISVQLERPVNPLVWAFIMFLGALVAIVPLALRGTGRRGAETPEENEGYLPEPGRKVDVLGETFQPPVLGETDSPLVGSGIAKRSDLQKLTFSIAQLDEEFASGSMEEGEYQTRRAALKKELLAQLEKSLDKTSGKTKAK